MEEGRGARRWRAPMQISAGGLGERRQRQEEEEEREEEGWDLGFGRSW